MAAPRTAVPGTAAGNRGVFSRQNDASGGQHTSLIYGLIRDGQLPEAVRILSQQLQSFPGSRPALALLGHCYYQLQDYPAASQVDTGLAIAYAHLQCLHTPH